MNTPIPNPWYEGARSKRRYEIAQAVACAAIQSGRYVGTKLAAEDVALMSVQFADALIAELRKPTPDDVESES